MLSLIIPTYNRLSELKRCIASVEAQYYRGLEVIIVDDRSSDATTDWLGELALTSEHFIIITNIVNSGVNFSRNRGIEQASQPFIFFLDSDDVLSESALETVRAHISNNSITQHFLFGVSDRAAEFEGETLDTRVNYQDWISGRVSGDYIHVVRSAIMQRHLFFEEFRTFEHLNWLRVKKLTAPQLFIPFVAANRERNRNDSLALSMTLKKPGAMASKFEADKIYYSMYYPDLKKYNPASLSGQLLQSIIIGAACNKKKDCKTMVNYASSARVRLLANFFLLWPPSFLKFGITQYSSLKHR